MLLLFAALAGALDSGSIAVVADSKRPGTEHDADELVSQLYLALVAAGVPRDQVLFESQADARLGSSAFSAARDCEGRRACLRGLAQLLGRDGVVIGVDVGRAGDALAAHLIAVSGAGEPVAEVDFSAELATWR